MSTDGNSPGTVFDALETTEGGKGDEPSAPSLLKGVFGTTEGCVGLVLLVLIVALAVIGPLLAPYSPYEVEVAVPLSPPSDEHWLGTDRIGRDVLSRYLNGGQALLVVPLAAVFLALVIGGSLGLAAAYFRGVFETVVMRLFDVMLSLPPLVVTLLIILIIDTSLAGLILALSVGYIPQFGRILRAAAQTAIASDYVLAAKARGESLPFILFREILPNTLTVVISEFSLRVSYATLSLAGLNFLGFGAQPPEPDWAVMVASSISTLHVSIWGAVAPGITIAVLAMSYNLLGESISIHNARGTRDNRMGL